MWTRKLSCSCLLRLTSFSIMALLMFLPFLHFMSAIHVCRKCMEGANHKSN